MDYEQVMAIKSSSQAYGRHLSAVEAGRHHKFHNSRTSGFEPK